MHVQKSWTRSRKFSFDLVLTVESCPTKSRCLFNLGVVRDVKLAARSCRMCHFELNRDRVTLFLYPIWCLYFETSLCCCMMLIFVCCCCCCFCCCWIWLACLRESVADFAFIMSRLFIADESWVDVIAFAVDDRFFCCCCSSLIRRVVDDFFDDVNSSVFGLVPCFWTFIYKI